MTWQPIETAPQGDDDFFLVCGVGDERSPFVVRGSILKSARQPEITTNRDWLFVGCEKGHDWRSLGGCNAGCHAECSCSVPVNFCRRCGDCDYGDNPEAEQVRVECAELWGDPSVRWAPDPTVVVGKSQS